MIVNNVVCHEGDGTNSNKSQQHKHQKEKEIINKNKKSENRKDPAKVKQRLTKLAGIQQQENWKNIKKNHNMIPYMHYTNLAIDQSNEIHLPTFWCYFDLHGNTTRMSNDPQPPTPNSQTEKQQNRKHQY